MKRSSTHSEEFFFIISPPADILKHISDLKRQVRKSIGRPFDTELSIGHISLHKDCAHQIESALYDIETRLSAIDSFDLHIKDFNTFSNSKTIFLDVVNKDVVHNVFESITQLRYQGVPHLTIAKNLAKPDFHKAWNHLTAMPFKTEFTVDRVKVLRRSRRRWLHHTDLLLKPKNCASGGRNPFPFYADQNVYQLPHGFQL